MPLIQHAQLRPTRLRRGPTDDRSLLMTRKGHTYRFDYRAGQEREVLSAMLIQMYAGMPGLCASDLFCAWAEMTE